MWRLLPSGMRCCAVWYEWLTFHRMINGRPTWYHLLFYFTYYVLNMFRTLIYPSSGACDCVDELPHRSSCSQFVVCWSFCCGLYLVVFVLQAEFNYESIDLTTHHNLDIQQPINLEQENCTICCVGHRVC